MSLSVSAKLIARWCTCDLDAKPIVPGLSVAPIQFLLIPASFSIFSFISESRTFVLFSPLVRGMGTSDSAAASGPMSGLPLSTNLRHSPARCEFLLL